MRRSRPGVLRAARAPRSGVARRRRTRKAHRWRWRVVRGAHMTSSDTDWFRGCPRSRAGARIRDCRQPGTGVASLERPSPPVWPHGGRSWPSRAGRRNPHRRRGGSAMIETHGEGRRVLDVDSLNRLRDVPAGDTARAVVERHECRPCMEREAATGEMARRVRNNRWPPVRSVELCDDQSAGHRVTGCSYRPACRSSFFPGPTPSGVDRFA